MSQATLGDIPVAEIRHAAAMVVHLDRGDVDAEIALDPEVTRRALAVVALGLAGTIAALTEGMDTADALTALVEYLVGAEAAEGEVL